MTEENGGFVGKKGRAVWVIWDRSGFFGCVRRKYAPNYAQNDDSGVGRTEEVEGRGLLAEFVRGKVRAVWVRWDRSGFFGCVRRKCAPNFAQNDDSGVGRTEEVEGPGLLAGLVGGKGRAVWVMWDRSGFFGEVRRKCAPNFAQNDGFSVGRTEEVEGRGLLAGLVGGKGQAVWVRWDRSGFFGCVRRKYAPNYAQNDGSGVGRTEEVEGPGLLAGLVGGKGRAVWVMWDRSGFFGEVRRKYAPNFAQNDGILAQRPSERG